MKIKHALSELTDLRPGSLSRQYNVCGNPTCRCKADPPRRHGPYYQVSFTWKGRSRSQFVRAEDVPRVRKQTKNYRRLRLLMEQWITAEMDLATLGLKRERALRAPSRTARKTTRAAAPASSGSTTSTPSSA